MSEVCLVTNERVFRVVVMNKTHSRNCDMRQTNWRIAWTSVDDQGTKALE